jgi:threonine/homoserine/homoserine lactone efflux protein
MMLTREVAIDARMEAIARSRLKLVLQGVLSNVTNPKIILFFFAFLPQFVDPASPHPRATSSRWACSTRCSACR